MAIRTPIFIIVLLSLALLAGFLISHYPPVYLLLGVIGFTIFLLSFINIEWGLYILIFSMILSPEIIVGETAKASLERGLTLRFEDFLLVVIGMSWYAKNAVHKELGLFLKTLLNKPILFYVVACILSTGFGIMTGRVELKTGSLFVLKYIEYFIVFFMVVNHVRSTQQLKRFIFCLFITCFISSIFGILQIPGGERVSAPFEGEIGEPNTFGGYLLLIGAIAAGLVSKAESSKIKQLSALLILFIIPPFLFTQSRSSYLALIPVCLVIGFMARHRIIIVGCIILALMMSPFLLPSLVTDRISYTFNQPEHPGQILIGNLRLDTSTSARLISLKHCLKDWLKHPVLGYGVTGYYFVDTQYPRVLVETGILGLISFFYLLYSIFILTIRNLNNVTTPYFKGIIIGFLAGYVGLLVHALGANTFIIVRIMEPFWFFMGIVAVLPELESQRGQAVSEINEIPRGNRSMLRALSQKRIPKYHSPSQPPRPKNRPHRAL
jgi:hypothetical protein